jgi:Zn finger protein HypA/HybF involved in hydrogenase expression
MTKPQKYRCQFCEQHSPAKEWKKDCCPKCGREYDPILAQDEEED